MIKEAIVKIVSKEDLTFEEAYTVMNEIMSGESTATQNAAFLAALSTKSARAETTDEIAGCAAAMRDHLLSLGIPDEQILTEDRSSDTEENMGFSAEIIRPIMADARVAYFTTNYHVFRSGIKARQAGLDAVGMGAPTRWYFWPNAAVREFIGLLTEHRRTQLLILAGMIAAYTALTVLALG